MKTTLLFFLLFLYNLFANDNDFSIIINKKFDAALLDITQDYNRQISAIGFSHQYNSSKSSYNDGFGYSSNYQQNGINMHLISINKYAEVTLSKRVLLSQLNRAVAILKTPQNGYYVGGYTQDGMLYLQKLDTKGNSIYSKIFGTKNKNLMSNIISLQDGGVLTIGTSYTTRERSENIFTTGLGKEDIYLTRFAPNGHIIWSKKYGTINDDRGIDAIETMDGSFIILGTTSYNNTKEISLMRLTQNGDTIWKKSIHSNKQLQAHKLLLLKDNSIVLSLSQINDMQKEQIRLIKFDIYKNILLDKQINTTYSSVLKDIKEFANGNIIGVGYVKDAFDTDALVMLFDNKFSLLNQEHYGDSNYDLFNALHIMNNSQVGAVGLHTSASSQESNMWIVILDSDGKIISKKKKSTNISKEVSSIFDTEITNNTLTTTFLQKKLSLTLKPLYFHQGKYTLTTTQKRFLDNFSKKLIPFLLQHQDSIVALQINGHTSSEWDGIHFQDRYLKNQKLSLNRAYSVLSYIFKKQDKKTQKYLSKILNATGHSYAKRVVYSGVEDEQKSRKVTFNIILKEEQGKFYH